jgi:hypothetical protein
MTSILKLAKDKEVLAGIYGKKEPVTNYSVHEAFTYLMLTKDMSDFEGRLFKIKSKT